MSVDGSGGSALGEINDFVEKPFEEAHLRNSDPFRAAYSGKTVSQVHASFAASKESQ